MSEMKLSFRYAEKRDVPLILELIRELAGYEKLEEEVVATEEILEEWLFEKKRAEVIFPMADGVALGYALFFHNFYIRPEYRGNGYGKAMIQKLAQIAVERGCGRLEWSCLDWNQPSIDFYLSLGAEPMKGWTVYRLAGETLKAAARS